jgi:hypothetical protein
MLRRFVPLTLALSLQGRGNDYPASLVSNYSFVEGVKLTHMIAE